eukprot:Lithocolla_globosa_v1_NODE_210_length_5154_cov_15.452834.p5 type:complete len:114 gc:universal NODE_210_length_5154_cov_15.452834:3369-3028(-)
MWSDNCMVVPGGQTQEARSHSGGGGERHTVKTFPQGQQTHSTQDTTESTSFKREERVGETDTRKASSSLEELEMLKRRLAIAEAETAALKGDKTTRKIPTDENLPALQMGNGR